MDISLDFVMMVIGAIVIPVTLIHYVKGFRYNIYGGKFHDHFKSPEELEEESEKETSKS